MNSTIVCAVDWVLLISYSSDTHVTLEVVGWLVGCFGFNGPLRQYFSLYQAVSQREKEERKDR